MRLQHNGSVRCERDTRCGGGSAATDRDDDFKPIAIFDADFCVIGPGDDFAVALDRQALSGQLHPLE